MSGSTSEAQLAVAAMRAAISEKRATNYANIEFLSSLDWSGGTYIFCSRRLCNPYVRCTLGHIP